MGDTLEDVSLQGNVQSEQKDKEWTVLVTGYGVSQLACVFHSSTSILVFHMFLRNAL